MFGQSSQQQAEADEEMTVVVEDEAASEVVVTSPETSKTFRIARLLYGGIAAFMALDNLQNLDERVGYAESKGAPMPQYSVPAISGALLGGGIGIALWRLPRLAAMAAASFFVSITPVMHDFWTMEGEERSQQQIHFLKNGALLGAALAFYTLARRSD